MKKTILILFLLVMNQAFCQDNNYTNPEKALIKVFGKCFEDLKPIEGTKNILPTKKEIRFCSLYQCVTRIGYSVDNKNIENEILKRTIEITTRLYNEGTPVYLMIGMGSFGEADEKNQDLTDDNNLVYISIAECISSNSLNRIQEIVNKTTTELIKNKLKTP